MNLREQRAQKITEDHITKIDNYTYKVKSQSSDNWYDVISTESGFVCSCPDATFRKVICKHQIGLEISLEIRKRVEETKQEQVTINPVEINGCKFCHGKSIKKYGVRKNKSGDIQRFLCQDCKKTFSINLGFEKMKSSPETITNSLQLYFSGESLRSIQKFLKLQGITVDHTTIYGWIKKYTRLMKAHLDKVTPQVGDAWRADEVYIKVRGELRYVFSLMDSETRFWIAQEVADRKEGHNARGLLQKAKEATGTKPKVFVTDGLPSYAEAYRKEFWTVKRADRTLHVRHIHLKGDMNNNKMERLNGEFRDREKVTRGVKKEDSAIFDGYQIYHNYVRPHMALEGKTPADVCGIDVKGENKWKTLIENASKE